jgi:uncharacterized membrane protein YgcG
MQMLRADLEAAVVPTGLLAAGFMAETSEESDGPADVLVFHALAGCQTGLEPPSPIVQVQIGLATEEDTEKKVLLRRTTANLLAPEEEEPFDEVLCRDVRSFDATFYDGTTWSESWDSTTQGDVLPLAVRVSVVLNVEDREDGYVFERTIALPCGALPEEERGGESAGGGGGGSGGGGGGFGGGGR